LARRSVSGAKSQANSSAPPPPQKGATLVAGSGHNRLYVLSNRQEVEASPDVITSKLQIFSRDAYVLLNPDSTLSYVTYFVAVSFGFEPDESTEPFSVSTPVGDSIMARRVYRNYVVTVCCRDTVADLIYLDMINFDTILGMDWLHSYYATLNYRTRRVTFFFLNEPVI